MSRRLFSDKAFEPHSSPNERARLPPPEPPIHITPYLATDPLTPPHILWHIAKHIPQMRRWLIANPAATPELLEYVSQVGGDYVKPSFEILFDSLHSPEPVHQYAHETTVK